MASYIKPDFLTLQASGNLSAKQYCFAKFGSDDDHVQACSVAGELGIGVIMNVASAAEEPVELAICDGAKVKLAGTVARGGEIMCDSAGKGVAATTGKKVMAIAMASGVSGDVIPVKLVNYELN